MGDFTVVEVVFICQAENEENEKVRSFYEGVEKVKDFQTPSVTQIVQSIRLINKKADPKVSVLGTKQLLNTKLKMAKSKFWTTNHYDKFTCNTSVASTETYTSLIPDELMSKVEPLEFLNINHANYRQRFEQYVRVSGAKSLLVVNSSQFFTHLLKSPLLMRNCDVYRLNITYTANECVRFVYSPPRLLFRSDLSTYYPHDSILSWRHILYGGGVDHSNSSNRVGNRNAIDDCGDRAAAVSVAYIGSETDSSSSGGGGKSSNTPAVVSTAIEDIDPICRICQVTYFEMPHRPLIKPCKCSGSVRYVHVDCLATWRATSPQAYTTCGMCQYQYRVRNSLLSRYLVNEDATFIAALLLMVPLTYCVGVAMLRLTTATASASVGASYFSQVLSSAQLSLAKYVMLSTEFVNNSQPVITVTPSPLVKLLLGANTLGIMGFFASPNPLSLLIQAVIYAASLRNTAVSLFVVVVGWGTVMRELHLGLIYALRQMNGWIGSIILEPS